MARIDGTSGDDVLPGTAQADEIYGYAGDDTLQGEAGDDQLIGGAGADVLDGGEGFDTISYGDSAQGVRVNLATGVVSGGDAEGDTIADIEHVRGSARADTLVGSAGDNMLRGGNGDDWLVGGAGADTLDGGFGWSDIASYSGSNAGVTVNLALGTGSGGDAEGDSIADDIEDASGSAYADTLTGNAEDNFLSGGAGNDVIRGEAGDDVLEGGAGADTLSGGDGIDLVGYGHSSAGVTVTIGGIAAGGDAQGDSIADDIEDVSGSVYADTLTGSAGDNTLNGNSGNDILRGGAGADILSGGSGTDLVSYSDSTKGATVNLAAGAGSGGTAHGDRLYSIETVIGSAHADTLIGSELDDTLIGGAGDDRITGGKGDDDTLTGGVGNDIFVYDAREFGEDTVTDFDAGDKIDLSALHIADFDTLKHFMEQDGSDVVITFGYGMWETFPPDPPWPNNELIRLENVSLDSLSADDFIFDTSTTPSGINGTDLYDVLFGNNGNNTFYNGDVIYAGGGDDYVQNSPRFLDGGAGIDTVALGNDFVHLGSSADLQSGQYVNVENVTGTYYDDIIRGDGGANVLRGLDDNDVLTGRGGADTLDGGAGSDTASYSDSTKGVTVDLAAGTGSGGTAQGDTLVSIEAVNGSAYADTLIGSGGANTLRGSVGDDVLRGGAGADTLDGGAGFDLVSYFDSTKGVTVNLAAGTGSGGTAPGDPLVSIEAVNGSAHADTLIGSSAANTLRGAAGKDLLTGGAGADRFAFTGGDSAAGRINADRITDFSHAQGDRIDLSAINANGGGAGNGSFAFIGTGAYTGVAGQLRYALSGTDAVIGGDVDGDGVSDFNIVLSNVGSLQASDFVL
ncbi:calcium-binding protein [Inquilinus sp. Marseille-Q2685]|uniref:beta strand repeat-containing protein n=1 Tax=Inquilinus sp. Marseille-Q2685 TaxID=2866581 RepID=UPI001CE3B75D|nr:calcium-binding protein [Inquilinus sp. Marseille-Q2685]